ncbi:amino acid ABC transporter substrate-binding protein [Variovorax sp. CCNWLW225]
MPKLRLPIPFGAAALAVAFALLLPHTAARAQDNNDTLAKIKASGAITFGYRESSFGFSYLDGALKPVGYSIEICNRIVEAVKSELKLPAIEIKYQAVTSANRIPLVQNGTIDIECGSTTNLVERQKQVAFSPDIFRYNVRMLVKADSGIKSIADLQGKTVVTTTGTTSFRLLREADKGRNLEVNNLGGKDHSDSFLLVESGRAQAFVLDDILLAGQIANARNPKDFVITGESLRREPVAHVPQGRPGLQGAGRPRGVGHDEVGRNGKALQQVVHVADSAQGHQHQLSAQRRDEGGLCQPVVQGHLTIPAA